MLKLTKKRIIIAICVLLILVSYIMYITQDETSIADPVQKPDVAPVQKPDVAVEKTIAPINPKLITPYIESDLRKEINKRHEKEEYQITSIVYRARWNAAENPIKHAKKWTEISQEYKKRVGEQKFHAIMNLADHDQMNEYNQIH